MAACALVVVGLFGGGETALAATGGGCQLSGNAVFSSPLGTAAHPFTYSFTGDLTNCKGSDSATPASGKISSGVPVTENGITYTPSYTDTGSGSCGSSTTAGTAVITWADGTVTVVKYSTTGVTAAVQLSGTVLPSVDYTGVDSSGKAVTKTFTTTRYLGGSSNGLLAFEANPADCAATKVGSAGIAGIVTINA